MASLINTTRNKPNCNRLNSLTAASGGMAAATVAGLSILFGFILLVATSEEAGAAGRMVAFVIGNSDYRHASSIRTASADADRMAATLKDSGFEVVAADNIGRIEFDDLFHKFLTLLAGADMGFFYYSGHSVQIAGQDRIIPVDADVATASDLEPQTIDLADIMQQMKLRAAIQIVIFDACRDDPFPRIAYYVGSRNEMVPTSPGCAKRPVTAGSLIALASEPGQPVVGDSYLTESLLSRAFQSGKDINVALAEARQDVIAKSDGAQVPYFSSALEDSVTVLRRGKAAAEMADQAESPGDGSGVEAPPAVKPATKPAKPQKKPAAERSAPASPPVSKRQSVEPVKIGESGRPNALRYSYGIWAKSTMRPGQRLTKKTSYGTLSCIAMGKGKRGDENARMCNWN